MTIKPTLGWRPERHYLHPEEVRVEGTLPSARAGAAKPVERVDLVRFIDGYSAGSLPMFAQVGERCVPHSVAELLWIAQALLGLEPQLADIHGLYVMGQRMEQKRIGRRAPLEDAGLVPRDEVLAMELLGVRFCDGPDDPVLARERILDDVFVDEYIAAARYKVAAWRRVPDAIVAPHPDDMPVVTELKAWLDRNVPAMCGVVLSPDALEWKNGVWRREPFAPFAGRHMIGLVSYDDQREAFLTTWHWGKDHGEGGLVWVSYSTISDFSSDRYVLDWERLKPPPTQGERAIAEAA